MKKINRKYIKALLLVVAVVMGVANLWAQEGSGNWKKNTPTSGNNTRKSSLMVPENSATVNRPLPNPGNPPAVEPDPVQSNNTASATVTVLCAAGTEQVQLTKTVLSNGAVVDVEGEALFYEDFGTSNINNGNIGRVESSYMPDNSFEFGNSYLQLPTPGGNSWDDNPIRNAARINDGFYAVVAPKNINKGWFQDDGWGSWWNIDINDANDSTDGAVMVINAGNNQNAFYQRNATLQVGAKYRVSFKLFVVQGPAQVGIDIIDPITKDVLTTMQTLQFGESSLYKGTQWETISIEFTMPGDPCDIKEVTVSLRNHKAETNGNDWYIDNIKFEKIEDAPLCPSGLECTDSGEISVNLNDAFTGTPPAGSELVWFTTENREVGTQVIDPENVTESGTYYAFFYDPFGECYNTDISTAKVTTVVLPPCTNYWMGGTENHENDWNVDTNWTSNRVPEPGEDIEFATEENNNGTAATHDLYLDNVNQDNSGGRIIGDLINGSDKNLVITQGNQLTVNGKVHDDNSGGIIVEAGNNKDDDNNIDAVSTGSLIFKDKEANKNVEATVEFYNQAYECADCGYFRKSWQYFGIPVASAYFPYGDVNGEETINIWTESYNGDKWRPVASGTALEAFKGYEITNSSTVKPDHIYEFKGKLNVGDATVGLTKTTTPAVNYSGMNLVANSFTAAIPIDADAIKYSATDWDGQVYLFNTGTRDQWRKLNGGSVIEGVNIQAGTYQSVPLNLAGQEGLPSQIPSMHTFMVNAPSAGTMTLAYDKLVKNELVDGKAWRSAEQNDKQEIPHIVLDVIGTQSADRVWLFEQHGTTRGFDNGWDGVKMPEKDIVQIYVAGEDAKENYQVATVPQLVGTAFGLNTVNTVETRHALSNQSQSQLQLHMAVSPDVEIRGLYLRDMLTGRSYALKNGAEYRVSGSISSDNRFKVVDNALDESKLSDNPLIDIYVQDNQVVVANNSEEDCTVSLFDISGRLVAKRDVASNGTTYVSTAISGVYVVKVIGGTVNESKRVVVK